MGIEPPAPRDAHIGRKAVELGLITADQLREVLLQLSQSGAKEPPLLGATLVLRGLLTQQQLGVLSDLAKGGPPKRVGKYHIEKELGRGGMGIVYEATDPELGRRVALKTLLPGFNVANETRILEEERFIREARLCANLPKHPNIVGVYEAGTSDEQRFIAMEFIEGRQFSDWRKPMPRRRQIEVLRDVALAVDHAHRHGVIHRDLKPANILVDPDNRPHVTDFGLAKRGSGEASFALTVSGEIMGTPAYMSPEQAGGKKEVDQRADIWALGVMLYEILTDRVPFEADTPLKMIMKTANEPAPPPSKVLRGPALTSLDRGLEIICMKALAKNPQARHATAKAFADDLTRWIKGEKTVRAAPKPAPPKTWLYAGAGAAVAVIAVVAVVMGTSSPPPPDPADRARDFVAQGQRLLAEGKPSEALYKFRRALEEDPGNRAAAAGKKDAENWKAPAPPAERPVAQAAPPAPAPLPPEDPAKKAREAIRKDLAELDVEQGRLREAEDFGPARDRLTAAAKRHDGAEWRDGIVDRIDDLRKAVSTLFAKVTAEATESKRAERAADVEALRARVEKWKWPGLPKELDDTLAAVVLTPTPAPAPAPAVPVPAAGGLVELPPFTGHKNAVNSIAFSSDAKLLLTSDYKALLWLWNTSTRKGTLLSEGREQFVSTAISQDGKWLAAGTADGKVRIWDAAKLQERTLSGHGTQVLGLTFTPDSKLLASASTDGTVRIWDPPSGTTRQMMSGHAKGAMCAAVSPDGKLLVVGAAEQAIRLWEISSGRDLKRFEIGIDTCTRIAFLPDGKTIVSGSKSGNVTLWDVATGRPQLLAAHPDEVRGIAVSPGGGWIATSSGKDGIRIWHPSTGVPLAAIRHDLSFFALAASPRGDLLVSGCGDHVLRVWDASTLPRQKPK
ncbi:MAG: serine/threonine protein kinase [Planctomycetes bacterium]|nr:serine/threonine protein kinase [Planctomycetota bacterium]